MLKQSLLALALVPCSAYTIPIWEANNILEAALKKEQFNKYHDLEPIKQFINEKISYSAEIANLQQILINAQQNLQVQQQKSLLSTVCLEAVNNVSCLINVAAALTGGCAAYLGGLLIGLRTIDNWTEHLAQVRFLSKYAKDRTALEVTGAMTAISKANDLPAMQQELNVIKSCGIAIGACAAVLAVGCTINILAQKALNHRYQTKEKIVAIQELIEYLRYQQGIAICKVIATAE